MQNNNKICMATDMYMDYYQYSQNLNEINQNLKLKTYVIETKRFTKSHTVSEKAMTYFKRKMALQIVRSSIGVVFAEI